MKKQYLNIVICIVTLCMLPLFFIVTCTNKIPLKKHTEENSSNYSEIKEEYSEISGAEGYEIITGIGASGGRLSEGRGSVSVNLRLEPAAPIEATNRIENLKRQLHDGVVVFKVPTKMKMGLKYRVELRIGDSITTELIEGLEGHQPILEIHDGVSATMKVILNGVGFDIDTLTSSQQLRKFNKPTIWKWDVKPNKSGSLVLIIRVIAILKVPGYSDETYDYETLERNIDVQVNYQKTIKDWIIKNWLNGIITAIATAFLGWVVKKWKKRKIKVK